MADLTVVSGSGAEFVNIEHGDIRKRVLDLRKTVDDSYWELSKSLKEVYSGSYYIAWGFQNWKEYVESELEFAQRKAQYLVSIQDWFGKMRPEIQAWVQSLGWTKSKELVGIVTEDNAADWKARLDGLSYRELVDELNAKTPIDETPIDGNADKPVQPEKPLRKAFALFPDQSTNVEAAIEKAKKLANTEKDGHALDLICSDFLATNAGSDDFFSVIRRLEKSSGLFMIAYDKENDAVVYGNDILDQIADEDEPEGEF
jgi:hypothetical protein